MLWIHSGLQLGGLPTNPSMQEQTAWPLNSLHILLGPHGDGSHGLIMETKTKNKS